jgi:hypothetical protein
VSSFPTRSDHGIHHNVAERVERILASRGLTLFQVSQETRRRYRGAAHYLIPHNFYYDLDLPGYSPRIEHLLSLSRITDFRLADWLSVFEFNLEHIPKLQAEFPHAWTSLLDQTGYDQDAYVPWFENVPRNSEPHPVAPLGQFLTEGALRRLDCLRAPGVSPYRYAKIGRLDALAFPDLLPGSIVRADTRNVGALLQGIANKHSNRFFLVEHANGLVCCRLQASRKDKITLRATSLPFAQAELQLGSEARVLGVLDWELRPLQASPPEIPDASMKFLNSEALRPIKPQMDLGELLAHARGRSGLSFRGASVKSKWIADTLREERYFCAPGSLTDYETSPRLPVHIHKIISLCILYSLGFWELLIAAGLGIADAGYDPIPNELIGRTLRTTDHNATEPSTKATVQEGFLSSLLADLEEVPYFLRHSLATLTQLSEFSLRDVFWIGHRTDSLHPYLRHAVFAAVNRRIKRPVFLKRKALWDQGLYILLLRDGRFLLTGCSIEGNTLVVHPFADGFSHPRTLQNGIDAEVVGKVAALFRWLR